MRAGMFRRWVMWDEKLVCVPAKCGSTSFHAAIMPEIHVNPWYAADAYLASIGAGPFTPMEVHRRFPKHEKWLAVRDPVRRFRSLWFDFCVDGRTDPNYRNYTGMSPDDLMDFIESFPCGDRHWVSQSSYLLPGVKLVKSRYLLTLLALPYRTLNPSARSGEPFPEDRILRHYAADLRLWEKAQ
jgi:hypothetical protein